MLTGSLLYNSGQVSCLSLVFIVYFRDKGNTTILHVYYKQQMDVHINTMFKKWDIFPKGACYTDYSEITNPIVAIHEPFHNSVLWDKHIILCIYYIYKYLSLWMLVYAIWFTNRNIWQNFASVHKLHIRWQTWPWPSSPESQNKLSFGKYVFW